MHWLRASILPLKIKDGRYQNLPTPEQVCVVCAGGCCRGRISFSFCVFFFKNVRIPRDSLCNKTFRRNVAFAFSSNEVQFLYLVKFEYVEVAKFLIRAYNFEKVNSTVLRY